MPNYPVVIPTRPPYPGGVAGPSAPPKPDPVVEAAKRIGENVRGRTEPVGRIFREKAGDPLQPLDPLGRSVADAVKDLPAPDQGRAMDVYNKSGGSHSIHREDIKGEGESITVEPKPAGTKSAAYEPLGYII